jgi:large subunit ribosomal protein L10
MSWHKALQRHRTSTLPYGELTAEKTSQLRRICLQKACIKLKVVEKIFAAKSFERAENKYYELIPALKGATSIMFSQVGNGPAKLIKEFKAKESIPQLKAAYVEESVYLVTTNLIF